MKKKDCKTMRGFEGRKRSSRKKELKNLVLEDSLHKVREGPWTPEKNLFWNWIELGSVLVVAFHVES